MKKWNISSKADHFKITPNFPCNVDNFTCRSTNFILPTPNTYSSYTQIMSTSLLTDPHFSTWWLNQKLFFSARSRMDYACCCIWKFGSLMWNQISETAYEKTCENWKQINSKVVFFQAKYLAWFHILYSCLVFSFLKWLFCIAFLDEW